MSELALLKSKEQSKIYFSNSPDVNWDAARKALLSQLSFKGEAQRFYKQGKRLFLKTTKFLYQIHQKKDGFRLQIMRAYAN